MTTIRNQMGAGTSANAAAATQGILANNLTATGNSQATALPLPSDFNIFTTVAASTGTIMPTLNAGFPAPTDYYTVVNHGANTLLVYPAVGGKIANAAANAGFSVPAGKTADFICLDGLNWAASVSA